MIKTWRKVVYELRKYLLPCKDIKMDSSGVMIEEQKLMAEPKYRVYMSNIDKALKNFEYSSEWADLISALGKLNKAISGSTQYHVIPRRIKISKRLAQCMHPALPSGVHLKALETYDVIFSKTGPERLATELFIYSSGLFPLLGYAAMNVRPSLLKIYETYFVPLGDKLRPALSGFLSGVIPGYESGLDHFERTNSLLSQVCSAVNPAYFYTCLWECVATNASIRLPAISYLLDHFNRRVGMHEQMSIMGKNHDVLMSGLVACLNDPVILVQRNTLEFLLLGFPMHTNLLTKADLIKLVTNGLNTILRRDMSLNRRLYSWLLGSEVSNQQKRLAPTMTTDSPEKSDKSYFDQHSKDVLIEGIKCTLKLSLQYSPVDLRPYRIMVSLLDKVEIGPVILDHVMCDVIRTMSLSNGNIEVTKSANLLFATFDPSYIWNFMTIIYEKSCKTVSEASTLARNLKASNAQTVVSEVGSGDPGLCEVCHLTEFLLETISLEMYNETTRVYLPRVFLSIVKILTAYSDYLSTEEVAASLKLCIKIVSRVQPMITSPTKLKLANSTKRPCSEDGTKSSTNNEGMSSLEKSKSDSKLNQAAHDDEPIRRSNSNQNIIKRSPKKTKKSKSYSKLLELDKDISDSIENIPSAGSTPDLDNRNKKSKTKRFSPSMKLRNLKGKSASDLKIEEDNLESLDSVQQEKDQTDKNEDLESNTPELQETSIQEYSILEKCIKQYEIFFQIYFSRQILHINSTSTVMSKPTCSVTINLDNGSSQNSSIISNEDIIEDNCSSRIDHIDKMFETLRLNDSSRTAKLHNLLHKTMSKPPASSDTSDYDYKECLSDSDKYGSVESLQSRKFIDDSTDTSVKQLMNLRLGQSLRSAVKLASSLLMEMSTFPSYNQNLILDDSVLPPPVWLKVLVLIACYSKSDRELQLATISTLFELISLLKSQLEHSSNPGVTYVVMIPLLKFAHINYLEFKTRTVQVITSSLWDILGDQTIDPFQTSSLLYQLHNCLSSGIVETIIGHRIGNSHVEWSDVDYFELNNSRTVINFEPRKIDRIAKYKMERLSDVKIMCTPPPQTLFDCNETLTESECERFKKFELLWEHGRETHNVKGFEGTLLKVLDQLALPYYASIRTFVTKWLQESLLHGDLSRLIRPLLKMMLSPCTKRISVVHAHLIKRDTDDNASDSLYDRSDEIDGENIADKDVYAISSEDGNIKYHIEMARSKKRSPIRSLQKKFFGVTIGNKNKTSNYISDKSTLPSESASNISLIVNPLDNSSDFETGDSENYSLTCSSSAPTKIEMNCNESIQPTPLKEAYCSSCEEETDESYSETESERHEESVERENPTQPGEVTCVKRFSGDCERVVDVLTEHDRTKNRKTYQVTKSGSRVIEKIEMSLAEVSEGIDILEESTPAEDYFSQSSSSAGGVEHLAIDILDQSTEKCEDEEFVRQSKSLPNIEETKPILRDSSKRFSCTSKTSSDSNQSREKSQSVEPESLSLCDSELTEEKVQLDSMDGSRDNRQSDEISQQKLNWQKAEGTFEISKKNVEILRKNAEMQGNVKFLPRKISQERKRHFDRLHPFHTHMLLYYGVYDTKQVLYAFQTLRNVIASDCRTFLCLSITSSMSNTPMKQLLVRHRKSIFGKGFAGSILNSEFNNVYRGCMYLEVLVTICLYYSRSFFQKEAADISKLPTSDDISGNCKIQLASLELLTLICTELISIVKDMGKGLACYISDLMGKCKLQKILLHCLISCVHSFQCKNDLTYTEGILAFNEQGDDKMHTESVQVQLLRLLLSVIKLEFEVTCQKGEESIKSVTTQDGSSGSPTRVSPSTPTNVKYLPNCPISQQPMFLSAVLKALQSEHLRHLHRNWTDVITSSLNCFAFGSLTNIVISVIHQICSNIDHIARTPQNFHIPPDYAVTQLEAVTVLSHYCLLDNTQQTSLTHLFNQSYPQMSSSVQSSNTGQLLNNIVHAILSTPSNEIQTRNAQIQAARNAVLSHLPVIVGSVARLWDTQLGQTRQVKQQLLEFLSPISLHHGINFLAAVSVTWQERADNSRRDSDPTLMVMRQNSNSDITSNYLPQACPNQLSLVKLVSNIRVMPMDSFVTTLHNVVKSPPNIHHPPIGLSIEVSALELFYFYMKQAPATQLGDCWSSLLALLRDGINLIAPAQFVILVILNEFVHRCPQMPFQDRKDLRDLHDVTSRLVEALSNVAGARLEQTTWLRRNFTVKEDIPHSFVDGFKETTPNIGNQQFSVQAQSVMAAVLANLLDIAYGSQEKDKVVAIVTTLMGNITPYLKNHTVRNIPSFYACSQLLASLSGFQYTRKAWRKDMFDLVLDPSFFQMDASCLPFWKSILDSLMTYDNTTFRELMGRVSLTQAGGLNIFTSREQEYEQRALLLKRLAFVIFCSELDQYHKYMPEIQEQLANSLRLPSVAPAVQASVFLCFRVLLLRMSPDHVTSLWPTIIAEMVQVFLAIEQELKSDSEELSQQIRILAGIDAPWANGVLHQHHLMNWRSVQLETAKLLELGCVLPATNLPHFQMYRWAFVGSQNDCFVGDAINGVQDLQMSSSVFVPHVRRISCLMDLRFTSHSPAANPNKGHYLTLTCQSINNLQDLYGFFSTLGAIWPPHNFDTADKEVTNCLSEIEQVLANDFLEKMPSAR
ncbi:Protein dopey-1 like [Pseudolycoriella hygida]|uniref:Protein dopey-1 like n=1 Tax=Pseudolycoriella hygida TaxID=35572 RepID=A0A9Q0N581_9DIPT|nr:Protein dopey-1 like [Pseudolycoriella hygida]